LSSGSNTIIKEELKEQEVKELEDMLDDLL